MDYAYLNQGGFDPSMSCSMSVGMEQSAALAAAAAAAAVSGGQLHGGVPSGPGSGSGYGGNGDPRCGPSMVPSPPAVGVHGYGPTSAYGAAMRSMHPGHHQYMAATGGGNSGVMTTGSCSMIPRPREHGQPPPGMFVSGKPITESYFLYTSS